MAMMTPEAFVKHVDHKVARKFATDILNILEPEKPKPKNGGKPKAKEEDKEGKIDQGKKKDAI